LLGVVQTPYIYRYYYIVRG